MFKIVSEGGTAAGVRRLFAATGHHALGVVRDMEDEMRRARVIAKAQGGDLVEKIGKLISTEKQLEKRIAELEKQLLEGGGGLEAMLKPARQIGEVTVLGVRAPDGTKMANLRELAEKLRDQLTAPATVLAAAVSDGKAQLALVVSKGAPKQLKAGLLIKPIAKLVGGSGGGRPDMAQAGGTDVDGVQAAVEAIYQQVESALAN